MTHTFLLPPLLLSTLLLLPFLISSPLVGVTALNNGVARTPVLGFNSWSAYGPNINATIMKETADFFVSSGLAALGYPYRYVSIDDGWAYQRSPSGFIIEDPTKFPLGMKDLVDYVHSKDLKFGLYSSASPKTCNQLPGSFGYEMNDAQTYVSWGVDLLKLDNCGDQAVIGTPESNYAIMRDALNISVTNTPGANPIVFSACEWAVNFPSTFMAPIANSWRTTYDLQPYWECIVSHVDWTNIYADFTGPGAVGDMDMLQVGLGNFTVSENRAHFALWAIMKSPILLSCPITSQACIDTVGIINNTEILAISQDVLVKPAKRVWSQGVQGVPYGKSGICGSEELPQNTIISPCNATDPLQKWQVLSNGTVFLPATGECLQLDSGQGGCCSQSWDVWTNNAASGLCNDPASCCNANQQLWNFGGASNRNIISNVSGQCLTVHAAGMHNVGVSPCSNALWGFQSWTFVNATGQFISSVTPPKLPSSSSSSSLASVSVESRSGSSGSTAPLGDRPPYCLARTPDVQGGAVEVWSGPLANGDIVVLLWNRNQPTATSITATWSMLGLDPVTKVQVRDLWAHADLGIMEGSLTASDIDIHDVAIYRLAFV